MREGRAAKGMVVAQVMNATGGETPEAKKSAETRPRDPKEEVSRGGAGGEGHTLRRWSQ